MIMLIGLTQQRYLEQYEFAVESTKRMGCTDAAPTGRRETLSAA